jgi:hypothetical protein
MGISGAEQQGSLVVSGKMRWLAVCTGCFTAVAGSLGYTWGFAIVPGILIVGAIVQPRFPRAGRVLISAGALSLSVWVLSFSIFILPESRFAGRTDVIALTLGAVLLVAWCDVAIVIEEVRLRRAQGEQKTEIVPVSSQIRWLAGATGCLTAATFTFDYGLGLLSIFLIVGALVAGRFPRNGRDLIWFGAVLVSLAELPFAISILLISTHGGRDPRVTVGAAVSVLLIVWCDAALVTRVLKARRARHR